MTGAAVCYKHIVSELGSETVWFVRLADGYLLDLGFGKAGEERATRLADQINGNAT